VQFLQLLVLRRRRRPHQQVLALLVHREGDDLAIADSELNADGPGRGAADGQPLEDPEPRPASRFISRGFSRGAAPDNLVFLPTAQERGALGGLRRDADGSASREPDQVSIRQPVPADRNLI
jgi:hypothetical protein